ncbi:MAG: Fe-S-binding domain-containing protein, partial [Gemmatimonadota bacterium]
MTSLLQTVAYESWALHALIWLPLVGMFVVLLGPRERAKHVAFAWSAGLFVLSLGLWWAFDPTGDLFQLSNRSEWIEAWGVSYALGVDGISLFMILLTGLTMPLAILGSFRYIEDRERAFYALMLLLQTGLVGVFASMDLFLFYVFFELTLVPMYFIIGVWVGERRI